MKKFSTLLALLLCYTAGVWAQVSLATAGVDATKAYSIKNARRGWGVSTTALVSVQTGSINPASANEQFAFVPYPAGSENVYLYSVGQQKFVNKNNSLSEIPQDRIYIWQTNNATYPLFFSFTNNKSNYNVNMTGTGAVVINTWNTYDDGNRNVLTEVAGANYDLATVQNSIANVTYTVMLDGQQVAQGTGYQKVGQSAALPASLTRGFCSYTYEPATITSGTTAVTATCTVSLPFTASTDFASATWYYFMHNNSGKYAQHIENQTNIPLQASWENVDTYKWAFIGTPYAGYKIINKGAGEGKFLYIATAANGNYPTMQTTERTWELVQGNGTGLFSFKSDGKFFNNYAGAGQLSFWQDGPMTDAGSNWKVRDASNFYAFVTEEITPHYAAIGQYFAPNLTVAEYEAQGYQVNKQNYTYEEYTNLKNLVTNASPKIPESGWYRIKSSGSRNNTTTYVAATDTIAQGSPNTHNLKTVTDLNHLGTYIQLIRQSTTGTAAVYKINCQGKGLVKPYNSQFDRPFELTANADAGDDFEIAAIPGLAGGYVGIKDQNVSGNNYFHEANAASNKSYVVRWSITNGAKNASAWQVEDVTPVTLKLNQVGNDYYATLTLPFPATIEGATAYAGDYNEDQSSMLMTPVRGIVPANTPVVLKGNQPTATITLATETGTPITSNIIQGTLQAMTWVETYLSLGKNNNEVPGFYKWIPDTGIKLGANRCYLNPGSTPIKGLAFSFDQATGISFVEDAASQPQAIYNLAGQRVSQPRKGLYIVNGKKVLY